jgi:hypothetical protein
VKLLKGDKVYEGRLTLELDPRATFGMDDRKANYDEAMKIYRMLGHMSYEVAAIQGARDGANTRAAKLSKDAPLRASLVQFSSKADKLRGEIVATKEGGAITGEERIREHVGQLYADVLRYEGRPTAYQVARADSLNRELEDVVADFNKLTAAELPGLNSGLQKEQLEPITIPNEADWLKEHASQAGSPVKTGVLQDVE